MIKRTLFSIDEHHEFQLLDGGHSDALCLVLPGSWYHSDMPVLYYLSHYFALERGQVLQARYSITTNAFIAPALRKTISEGDYSRFMVVAKAIGTVRAGELIRKIPELKEAPVVWLTPLLKSKPLFRNMMEMSNPSLIITGDHDLTHFDQELLDQLAEKDNVEVMICKGATHSLEYHDKPNIEASLDILKEIIGRTRSFCERQKKT